MAPILVLLASLAQAADAQPGLFLPGANEVRAFTGSAGTGVWCGTDGACGPVLQGDVALTRSLVILGQAPVLFEEEEVRTPITVGARYDLLDVRVVRVAVFGLYGTPSDWHASFDPLDGASVGLTARAGFADLWVDAAVPIVHVDRDVDVKVGTDALDAAEVGVNIGPGERHVIRAGLTQRSPELSYRYEAAWFYGEAGGAWLTRGDDDGSLLGRAQLGLRF